MIEERIGISVNDYVSPAIAINFRKIAKEAGTAAASVEALKKSINGLNQASFAGIASSMRGMGGAISEHIAALDRLAKSHADARSTMAGGINGTIGIDAKSLDNLRQSISQVTILNSLLGSAATATSLAAIQAEKLAAAYTAAATAAGSIRPSVPNMPNGDGSRIGRDMKDAARETHGFTGAQRDMLNIMSGNGGTITATRLLAGGIGMVGAAATIGAISIGVIADQYKILTGQLRIATGSLAEYGHVLSEVRRISSETDTSLVSNGKLYGRLSRSLDEHNVINGNKIAIMEAVTNSLKANSATAQESASAILQMSQAFSHGTLQGQEFNSMADVAPSLMRQLAKSMGIEYGKMKSYVEDQKVTWEAMVKAWSDPAFINEMKRQAKEVQLLSGAWQDLKDRLMFAVGEFDKATGISRSLISTLDSIGNSADSIVDAFTKMSALLVPIGGLLEKFKILENVNEWLSPFAYMGKLASFSKDIIDEQYQKEVAAPRVAKFKSKFGDMGASRLGIGLTSRVEFDVQNKKIGTEKDEAAKKLKEASDKAAKERTSDLARELEQRKQYIESLREEAATMGLSSDQLKYYELAKKAASMPEYAAEIYNYANAIHAQSSALETEEQQLKDALVLRDQIIDKYAEETEARLNATRYENERLGESAKEALELKRSLMTDEQRLIQDAGDAWDKYTRMIADGHLTSAEALRLYTKEFDPLESAFDSLMKTSKDSFADFLMDFKGGLGGMVDAFSNAIRRMVAEKISSGLFDYIAGSVGAGGGISNMLNNAGMGFIGKTIGGLMGGGISAPMMSVGVAEGLIGDLAGFDGGGYTGSGPRSGGLDGKGGFMAMLHPQETVIDHTKGHQAKGGDTYVTNVSFNVSGDLGSKQTQQQAAAHMSRIANSGRRNM